MGTVANEAMRTYGITNGKDLVEMYPIGSIYISVDSTSPASLFGGTWEQLEEGQFLMNTYLSDKLGADIPAGLPNISGSFLTYTYVNVSEFTDGPFKVSVNNPSGVSGSSIDKPYIHVNFNASRANSIYSDDISTVQPYSLGVRIWKRINPTS